MDVALVVELVVVEQLELDLVRDGEDREAQLRAAVVEVVLHVRRDPVGALVEDDEGGPVVEEPREGQTLLLARREVLLPVALVVQARPHDLAVCGELQVRAAVFPQHPGRGVRPLQARVDVRVGAARRQHLRARLRVDHEVAQRAHGHEVHLREEVDLVLRGHGDGALHERPELADHAEEAGLATTVGARDEHALPAAHREAQVLDQERAVGLVDRDVLEAEVLAAPVGRRMWSLLRRLDLSLQHGRPLLEARHEGAHAGRQAAEAAHAVRELEEVLDGGGHGLHVAPGGGEVLRNLLGGVGGHAVHPQAQRPREQEQADDRDEVLVQVLPHDFGVVCQTRGEALVRQEPLEVPVQHPELGGLAAQEGDLLAVGDEVGVRCAQAALELLLLRRKLAKGRQRHGAHAGSQGKPGVERQRREEALHAAELHGVDEEVHDGLQGLRQHLCEDLREDPYVGGDLVVAVLDLLLAHFVGLVEDHVPGAHVPLVAPERDPLADLLLQRGDVELQKRVQHRQRERRPGKLRDQPPHAGEVPAHYGVHDAAPVARDPDRAARPKQQHEAELRHGPGLATSAGPSQDARKHIPEALAAGRGLRGCDSCRSAVLRLAGLVGLEGLRPLAELADEEQEAQRRE
mmetsp:Transcript_39528/g.123108  ORF Transcript_39528/g.123108 Transcript_39528/m.123108 type:complete len:632 (-) Transcript_39528:93-1988(-)